MHPAQVIVRDHLLLLSSTGAQGTYQTLKASINVQGLKQAAHVPLMTVPN